MTELQNQRAFGAQALEKLAVTQHLVPIAQAKLRIRLGVDHLITKAYDDVKDELNKLKKVIRKESQNEPEDRAADCKEHEEFARKAMERFAAGAAALMNVPDSGFSSSDAQERVSQAISAYLDDGEDSASD